MARWHRKLNDKVAQDTMSNGTCHLLRSGTCHHMSAFRVSLGKLIMANEFRALKIAGLTCSDSCDGQARLAVHHDIALHFQQAD